MFKALLLLWGCIVGSVSHNFNLSPSISPAISPIVDVLGIHSGGWVHVAQCCGWWLGNDSEALTNEEHGSERFGRRKCRVYLRDC